MLYWLKRDITVRQNNFSKNLDIDADDILTLEGEYKSTEFLRQMAEHKKSGKLYVYPVLIDILYCDGCIAGKAMGIKCDLMEARNIILKYTRERFKECEEGWIRKYKAYKVVVKNTVEAPEFNKWMSMVEDLIKNHGFKRKWRNMLYKKKIPSEAELIAIMKEDGRDKPENQLNCGACGYKSCRDRAIAVYNGENEPGRCPVHQEEVLEQQRIEAIETKNALLENVESLSTAISEIAKGNQDNAASQAKLLENVEEQVEELDKITNELVRKTDIVKELTTSQAAVSEQIAASSQELHAAADSLRSITGSSTSRDS